MNSILDHTVVISTNYPKTEDREFFYWLCSSKILETCAFYGGKLSVAHFYIFWATFHERNLEISHIRARN